MYEALISDLLERLESFPADGFSLDYCRIRGACDAMEAMNEKLFALQAENAEKDKRIACVEAERDAAKKCIYDIETYLAFGSAQYIGITIQAWKSGTQGEA